MTDNVSAFDNTAKGEAIASSDVLDRLRGEFQNLAGTMEAIEQAEDDLKALKKEQQRLRTQVIPDLMAEIQSDHFTFAGYEFKLDEFVSGSLPKDPEKRKAAIKWLEEHEAGGLIKTDVNMTFGKSQHNVAVDLAETLIKEGHVVEVTSGVHTQTLHKFVRDRLAAGDPIDLEVLGVFTGKVVKAKKAKK